MIVVADTSPLRYLIVLQQADVLRALFQRVVIPEEVWLELRHPGAPDEVRRWIAEAPAWLEIHPASPAPDALIDLDAGEAAAIRLAAEYQGSAFLLMDDAKGRREAGRRGIPSTGTLGVLRAASQRRLLSLHDVLPRLLLTNFFIASSLVDALIAEESSRRS